MLKFLIVALVVFLLSGCAATVSMEAVNDAHPDWSNRTCEQVAKLETWPGMTIEQYECVLGRGMDRLGWQPGLVGWAAMGFYNHRHITPDSVLHLDGGVEIVLGRGQQPVRLKTADHAHLAGCASISIESVARQYLQLRGIEQQVDRTTEADSMELDGELQQLGGGPRPHSLHPF